MKFIGFPTEQEWAELRKFSPHEKLKACMAKLDEKNLSEPVSGWYGITDKVEILEWTYQVASRLDSAIASYMLLSYYYNQGIPDDKWYISPGKDNVSIQYFPDFSEEHHYIKDWFDYHADVCYYKLFSALDLIGHILNVKYKLDIKPNKVHFKTAVVALKSSNKALHCQLNTVCEHSDFKLANEIRNNITHNHSPSSTGLGVSKTKTSEYTHVKVSVREYTTSTSVINNIRTTFDLVEKVLLYLSA